MSSHCGTAEQNFTGSSPTIIVKVIDFFGKRTNAVGGSLEVERFLSLARIFVLLSNVDDERFVCFFVASKGRVHLSTRNMEQVGRKLILLIPE